MSEITISQDLLVAVIAVVGSLLGGSTAVTRYRTKLGDVRGFFVALDDALQDGEITPEEAKRILQKGKRIFNL